MRIVHNRIRCNLCGDQIESRKRHDLVMCRCGSCGADGGQYYLRRLGRKEDFTELSVTEEEPLKEEGGFSEMNHCGVCK